MPKPTLLVPGSLSGYTETPIDVICAWITTRMAVFNYTRALLEDRILMIRARTGTGKSTVLPTAIFRILRNKSTSPGLHYRGKSIICTQPRVLTAISIARGLAADTVNYPDMTLGETVGYQTKELTLKPVAGLVFATIGTLSAQLRMFDDSSIMDDYFCIILDEAHERSLESDITLAQLKEFYKRNEGNTKLPFLILASATFSPHKYAEYFGLTSKNIFDVTGMTFPLDMRWPAIGTNDYAQTMVTIMEEINKSVDEEGQNDVLIFLPGGQEIKKVRSLLEPLVDKGTAKLILLAIDREAVIEQSAEYNMVFMTVPQLRQFLKLEANVAVRRVVLSTNVAETGLTINSLKYVIDSGWARCVETYFPDKISALITKPVYKSQARQRFGRVGRLFPGVVYPTYTENTFKSLEEQQLPELFTNGIATIFLTLLTLGRTDLQKLDLLDNPPFDALWSANSTAYLLGMVDRDLQLTSYGKIAASFSRITMEGARLLFSALVWQISLYDIATMLAVSKPFEEKDVAAIRPAFCGTYNCDFINAVLMVIHSTVPDTMLSLRETLIDEIIVSGLMEHDKGVSLLNITTAEEFTDYVLKVKRCLYEAYRCNLLCAVDGKHHNYQGKQIKTRFPAAKYIITDKIQMKNFVVKSSVDTVLDGYVTPDIDFVLPV